MTEEIDKICIFCKHWTMTMAGEAWSAITAGNDYDENCYMGKGQWSEFDSYATTKEEYRKMINYAKECDCFTLPEEDL